MGGCEVFLYGLSWSVEGRLKRVDDELAYSIQQVFAMRD